MSSSESIVPAWWFSFTRRGAVDRIRKSLDAVLEKHIDSKTIAEQEAGRLRIGTSRGCGSDRFCKRLVPSMHARRRIRGRDQRDRAALGTETPRPIGQCGIDVHLVHSLAGRAL
jgi:hypothetical protein